MGLHWTVLFPVWLPDMFRLQSVVELSPTACCYFTVFTIKAAFGDGLSDLNELTVG